MTGKVKICGISTLPALKCALDNKSDFIGLVFYQPSPRNISINKAAELADRARDHTKIVALTVDPDDELLSEIAAKIQPDYLQLHGSETPKRVRAIKIKYGLPIIKAIKVRSREDVAQADRYENIADIILFDAKAPDNSRDALPGGNGVRFDWSLLETNTQTKGFMLSGGLNPDNIAQAVTGTDAAIFDVSSGVETKPGQKDLAAIKNFIVAMRNAG